MDLAGLYQNSYASLVFLLCSEEKEMNAIMTNFDLDNSEAQVTRKWEGLSEIDQAIRENRLMEYRIRKSWADPWGRKLTIFGTFVILAMFAFLAGASLGLW